MRSPVCFDWRTRRRHGELTSLIEGFGGVLQSDGHEAYAAYERAHPEVAWVGCWAHARRKFIEAQGENPKAARVALKLIGRLYRWEREWDEADHAAGRERDVAERARLRARHRERTLRWLPALTLVLRERLRPRSGTGVSSGDLLSQGTPLSRHVEHGPTRLDNNLVVSSEATVCQTPSAPPQSERKTGSSSATPTPAAAPPSSTRSSSPACATAKTPLAYLRDVLTRLPSMTNLDDLDALTPSGWTPA